MKLGQAMYEQQQAQPDAGGPEEATAAAADEDVVDAEFSEVDEEQKQDQ
jgi:molecular chaperone DnaK